MTVRPIPEGYSTVTPYLIVRGGREAIDFYTRALGAVELYRMDAAGGKVGHAELRIGSGRVMLADEVPEMGAVGPATLGGAGVHLMLYVEDVDTRFARALAAGATEVQPVKDRFYGDPAELERRAREAFPEQTGG